MDLAALQRVTLVRTSGTLCWTVGSAREQQSLHTWIVSFRISVSSAGPLVGRVVCILDPKLTLGFCYAAMHCRYFAETKTLWKHLNSSADTFQFGAAEAMHSCLRLRRDLLQAFLSDRHHNRVLTTFDSA